MKNNFVETTINIRQGRFKMRVYAAPQGKETVVMYTEKLDKKKAVLARVHSECMTGDVFHSLQCDCGEQLDRSLQIIHKQGGVLIYLRQEGRGIGLFEKIKTYNIQQKGYDTFEANVMIGHNPDERTYEMVKTALDDLRIKKIKLLTNNPSKISEIAKEGIKVESREPLIIASNKFNKHYFDAKRDKFKHFFHSELSYYFYQFHANNVKQIEQIGSFLKNKKRDPLLKICVGISANNQTLKNESEIENTRKLFEACDFYEGFVPILHFSFKKSPDTQRDLKDIKKRMPFVKYIQTNDLPNNDLPAIKLACKLFLADIPLSDANFKLVKNASFRKTIADYKAFILLDNSKGTGIRESKESLMTKIDILTKCGLNDIAIFGGFGPDDLDTYFELRRFYKINFSIDAESKLKTDGTIDIDKTKIYLQQLIRYDDPNQSGINQTLAFLNENKKKDWESVVIEDSKFLVHPAVFNAANFPSTTWFTKETLKLIKNSKSFCEVGCGAGITACLVSLKNKNVKKVVATDINPFAAENAKVNADDLGLKNIEVYSGDVLDGIPAGMKFDAIFWSLPFGFMDPGKDIDYEAMQFFDPGYRAIRKFFKTAKDYLNPKGQLIIGYSPDLANNDLFHELARQYHLKLNTISGTEVKEAETISIQILKGIYK